MDKIFNISKNYKKILVCLDSDHTHKHVFEELQNYSKLVSKDSYLVVFDTTQGTFDNKNINKISKVYKYKPWGKKSNPLTAVKKFLKYNKNFIVNDDLFKKSFNFKLLFWFLEKNKIN